ncbi:hypothetical protein T06_7582 [Trichinella sp. T6]|nr:hypothetical protein T06_7582 [Trichinella sp. T6]
MKKNRLAKNREILHKTVQFQQIPPYSAENASITKIQASWLCFWRAHAKFRGNLFNK